MLEHLARFKMFPMGPAAVLMIFEQRDVLPFEPFGICLAFQSGLIQSLHEDEVGDLLDGCQGIGNPSGPGEVPEFVYFGS